MWPTHLDFCAKSKTHEAVQRRPQKAAVGIYWVWKWQDWDARALLLVTARWTYTHISDSKTRFQALYFCKSLFCIPVTTQNPSKQTTTKPSRVFDLGVRPLSGVVLESAVCMIKKKKDSSLNDPAGKGYFWSMIYFYFCSAVSHEAWWQRPVLQS